MEIKKNVLRVSITYINFPFLYVEGERGKKCVYHRVMCVRVRNKKSKLHRVVRKVVIVFSRT